MEDPTVIGPSLEQYAAPDTVIGAILMLHGGRESGEQIVDDRNLSWRRSAAMAGAIAPRAEAAGAAVWLLRYRRRGWNGGTGPVEDARWALDRVRQQVGELPITLLGHSMGARTAVHAADDPDVRGIVALAPWFPRREPIRALAGRSLVAAHGSRDRITSPRATRDYVERARAAGGQASYVDMGRVGHYMLRRTPVWNELALAESLKVLG